ncbi:low molecular weight protein-tyrosine-phosphatase [Shewanella marina]|uniref:low molecular weight protein-tyrosine-phosphatase n=1 Tax=Shewanella marina TaxID=487319 RepID=UPI0004729E0C|nr:low molecular weight protein-tyrosine-phosphatase [Shewanella marina]
MKKISSVLFVCMGNICRSPTAEAVFRRAAKDAGLTIEVDSAGTIGHHQGELPDRRSRAAGEARGIDFTGIRSRKVVDNDFVHFDLILAADNQNLNDLRERCPQQYQYKLKLILDFTDTPGREVPDPYYGGGQGFELVLDMLEDASRGLIDSIAET